MVKTNDKSEKNTDDAAGILGFIKSMGNYFNILLIAATFFVNYGMFRADYTHLQQRIDDIEAVKPEQLKWISDQHEKRITSVEADQKSVRDTVFEMKTKIDVIAEWVADQKAALHNTH